MRCGSTFHRDSDRGSWSCMEWLGRISRSLSEISSDPGTRQTVRESGPSAYLKRLIVLAQMPVAYRSTCSVVREAAAELAIAGPSPRRDSSSELLLSDPLKALQYLAARRPFARLGSGLLKTRLGCLVTRTPSKVVQGWEPNRSPPLEAGLHLSENPHLARLIHEG